MKNGKEKQLVLDAIADYMVKNHMHGQSRTVTPMDQGSPWRVSIEGVPSAGSMIAHVQALLPSMKITLISESDKITIEVTLK